MSLFSKIAKPRVKKSKFDLSRERKSTYSFNKLYPIFLEECLPGDRFRIKNECMIKALPMLAPVMHRVNVKMNFFYVPTRTIWDEWEDFITGGRLGTSSPEAPWLSLGSFSLLGNQSEFWQNGGLLDHFGLPTGGEITTPSPGRISQLPLRAYQFIYNEYFRDQNLEAEIPIPQGSGQASTEDDIARLCTMRLANWEKDYFTSALPFPQRGPEVLMPVEGEATINWRSVGSIVDESGVPLDAQSGLQVDNGDFDGEFKTDSGTRVNLRNITDIEVDGISTTINDFRKAVTIQQWLEKAARVGSRYVEQLTGFFGTHNGDAVLQRPQYIGGYSQPLMISEVLSTVDQTGEGLPQGNQSGHSLSVGASTMSYKCREHGYIVGVMAIVPRTAYQQGISRLWTREDKFDYAFPEFANLGEQEVFNQEVFLRTNVTSEANKATWGYQSRFAEYKYAQSTVHANMKDNLAFWHLGRIFDAFPVLNNDFVKASASNRVFPVVSDDDKFYAQMYQKVDAIRPLPFFGTPGISRI